MQECSNMNYYLHKVKLMLDFGAQGPLLDKTMHLLTTKKINGFFSISIFDLLALRQFSSKGYVNSALLSKICGINRLIFRENGFN